MALSPSLWRVSRAGAAGDRAAGESGGAAALPCPAGGQPAPENAPAGGAPVQVVPLGAAQREALADHRAGRTKILAESQPNCHVRTAERARNAQTKPSF
jgi:hypothetical protein